MSRIRREKPDDGAPGPPARDGSRGRQLVARLAAFAALLALSSAAVRGGDARTSAGTDGAVSDPPVRVVEAGGVEFHISISRTANLFHWIDNLAGSSPAKTRDVYLQAWMRRFGDRDPDDHRVLRAFRDARRWSAGDGTVVERRGGCLPEQPREATARQRLSAAAMSARDTGELAASARRILPARHAGAVAEALERFDARFDQLWRKAHDLEPFAESLARFLGRRRTRRMITRMASFYGARLAGGPPVTISLIALPRRGPTHAEADDHHLLIEIPEGDSVERHVSVVFHELAHDLERRVPAERRESLARAFFAGGPAGSLAWSLLAEGLPRALGPGVAQAELAPREFRPKHRWYHRREIDAFARAVFPDVRRQIARGGALDEALAGRIVAEAQRALVGKMPLFGLLSETVVATNAAGRGAVEPLRRGLRSRGWHVRWDDPAAARFIDDHRCVSVILLATRDELARLPPGLKRELGPLLAEAPAAGHGGLGVLVPGRRGSGSPALLLIAETDAQRDDVVRATGRLVGWPEGPVVLGIDGP